MKSRRRPRKQWKEIELPEFKDFLPEHVRDAARAATLEYLEKIADGKPIDRINRDPHFDSTFILKTLLRCKHTGALMTGRIGGRKGKNGRKYGISKGSHIPKKGVSLKRVLANPIEKSVMELVRTVALNRPRLVEAMQAVLARSKGGAHLEQPRDLTGIKKQIAKLKNQIVALSDEMDDGETPDANDPIKRKIALAKEQIAKLNTIIRESNFTPAKPQDPYRAIERIAEDLADFGRKIEPTDSALIVGVLELLVSRLEVDRDTKEFEIELAVPSWLPDFLTRPLPAGLESLIGCKPQIEALPENREILGSFRCQASVRSVCYACRRNYAA